MQLSHGEQEAHDTGSVPAAQGRVAVQLTREVKEVALRAGADVVGISSAERMAQAPHTAEELLPGARALVVVGVRIPQATAKRWEQIKTPYHVYGHGILNFKLSYIDLDVSRFLEDSGYYALPFSSRDPQYNPDTFLTVGVSMRHAAAIAGLGEFGWSNLLLHPRFGPRVRYSAILTTAPLQADPLYHGKPLCIKDTGCTRCIDACPMGVLSGEDKTVIEVENKRFEMAELTPSLKQRCRWAEHGLVARAGARTDIEPPDEITTADYIAAGARMDPVQKSRSGSMGGVYYCGKCVHSCPVGDNRMRPARVD
jgi:epoxyqueuosine reductase